MKRLYISDMDGTLLQDDGTISKYAIKELQTLIDQGVNFSVASARDYHAIRAGLLDLELKLPVIECNGAYISEFVTGKKLFVQSIEKIEVEPILEVFEKLQLPVMLRTYGEKEQLFFTKNHQNEFFKSYLDFRISTGDTELFVQEDLTIQKGDRLMMVNTIAKTEDVLMLIKELDEQELEGIEYHAMSAGSKGISFFNLSGSHANKANAMKILKREFFDFEDLCTCFGDNINDIELLQASDYAIAVENAHPKVKEVSNQVIGFNRDDAVVEYIKRKEV